MDVTLRTIVDSVTQSKVLTDYGSVQYFVSALDKS